MAYVRSRAYRPTGPDDDTVITVLRRAFRDGLRGRHACCEICGGGIIGERGVHWSVHHRVPRGMGGTRAARVNQPQSLMVVDGSATTGCHGRIESDRAEALASGWLVSRYADPANVAVLIDRGSRWVYLTASGGYADNPPGGAL